MVALLRGKGAVDLFPSANFQKVQKELEHSFCGHFCKLFDKKFDTWFDSFQAVNVRLTAHVKVSNFVRVLTGIHLVNVWREHSHFITSKQVISK